MSSLPHWDAHLPLFSLFDITNDKDPGDIPYFLIAKQRQLQLVMISKSDHTSKILISAI
jgi:hypothetical protein